MRREPTHGDTPGFDWTEPPRHEADEHGTGGRGKPDPELIVAGVALVAALVLVILAF